MMKTYISTLVMLLISIIYLGCAGQTKYYIKETVTPNPENSVKITLHRNSFSVCDWYALDDHAYGPKNSLIGIMVGSPAPIDGMLTNSRYALRFYYIDPDYEDIYGIVDNIGFSLYEVTSNKSENNISEEFKFSSRDLVVSTGSGTEAKLLYDTNEKGERRAVVPYRVLSDLIGSSKSKVVTIPVSTFDKKMQKAYHYYLRREKTIGRIANDEKVSWMRKPGLSRIAIVNECPGTGRYPDSPSTSHYMASDPIFFKEGYAYEFEYELVTGYKWGEFNMITEPEKIQNSQ